MKWSRKQPTKPGIYWYHSTGFTEAIIAEIERSDDNMLLARFLQDNRAPDYLRHFPGWWYGPLEYPTPPEASDEQ